jgi:hypothetical protein
MCLRSHLRWIVQIPVICQHCGRMSLDHVANLARHDELPCAHCGEPIKLTSDQWRAYINEFEKALTHIDSTYEKFIFP